MAAGDIVTFNCSVLFNGTTRRWKFIFTSPSNTTGVVVNDHSNSVRLYTITSVRSSHAGLYSCNVVGAELVVRALRVKCK